MKKILTNNLKLKALAILIALLGWLVIINYDDPTITKTIHSVKVTVQNEDSIRNQGKCYYIDSSDSVDIVIKGKKSIIDLLSASDFTATADLSKNSITNAVPVEVSCNKDVDIEIVDNKSTTIMISLDDYVTKQYTVSANIKGTVADGYYISNSEISISPNRITVEGPAKVISNVASIKCIVDVSDANSEFSTISEPAAFDSQNRRIASSEIKYSINSISVKGTPINMTTVPVNVVVTGEIPDGYVVEKTETSVEEVSVAGSDASYIKKLESVDVTVDASLLTKDYEETLNLSSFIETGSKVVSNDKKTDIKITVRKLEEQTIDFRASDVKFSNLPNDVVCNYDSNYALSVKVRGLSEVLEELDIDKLSPSVDVGEIGLGSRELTIKFADVEGIDVMDEVTLPVVFEQKQVVSEKDNDNKDNKKDSTKEDESTGDTKTEKTDDAGNTDGTDGTTDDSSDDGSDDSSGTDDKTKSTDDVTDVN